MNRYKVRLTLTYTVDAPNREEAQSAAWRAHDEEMVPEWVGASVDRIFSPIPERGVPG